MKNRSRWPRLLLAAGLLFAVGCVQKETDGERSIYTMESWGWVLLALVSSITIPVGMFSKPPKNWIRYAIMPIGPILGLLIIPGIAQDHTLVDEKHFETTHGFWFAPNHYAVQFGDVRSLEVTMKERASRGGPRRDYTLHCHLKNGRTVAIPLGDVIKRAWPEIQERAERAGIAVAGGVP